jgi:hypothetical protein
LDPDETPAADDLVAWVVVRLAGIVTVEQMRTGSAAPADSGGRAGRGLAMRAFPRARAMQLARRAAAMGLPSGGREFTIGVDRDGRLAVHRLQFVRMQPGRPVGVVDRTEIVQAAAPPSRMRRHLNLLYRDGTLIDLLVIGRRRSSPAALQAIVTALSP